MENDQIIDKIKNYTKNNNNNYWNTIKNYIKIYNEKSALIKIEIDPNNINNLIFIRKIEFDFGEKLEEKQTLNNAYIYDWEKIINNNSMLSLDFNIPFKYILLDFIKIEYLNEFNFIKYTYGFIEEFSFKVSKSNTIISLLNEIYPGCEKIFNEKSDFINGLIKKILSRLFLFPIFSYKRGLTMTTYKRMYFFLVYTYNRKFDLDIIWKYF